MKYSVVIFPSSRVQETANSYRKRYDPTYITIPPFIRLKEAFELAEDRLPELVNSLQQVADTTAPFPIRFNRAKSFFPANNVIYLALEQTDAVTHLHEQIREACGNEQESYVYVPHLTIGNGLTDDELKDVLGQLRMLTFDLACDVDRFHLVYQLEDGTWSVHQTFLLKK